MGLDESLEAHEGSGLAAHIERNPLLTMPLERLQDCLHYATPRSVG